jgi:hypothetical protein
METTGSYQYPGETDSLWLGVESRRKSNFNFRITTATLNLE